jgi:chromate transporter
VQTCSPRRLFGLFFRIGLFTFGGGMAMIPLIRHQLCERHGLVTDEQFLESIAVSQCAPGPIACNLGVMLGYRICGWRGAAAALFGVATPAFLVLLTIAWQYQVWREQLWAARLFAGLRPAIVVLIAHAALRFGRMALRDHWAWAVYLVSVVGLVLLRLHPLAIIGGAALLAAVQAALQPPWGYAGQDRARGGGGGGSGGSVR